MSGLASPSSSSRGTTTLILLQPIGLFNLYEEPSRRTYIVMSGLASPSSSSPTGLAPHADPFLPLPAHCRCCATTRQQSWYILASVADGTVLALQTE